MRGESTATGTRSLPSITRRSWSSWITEVKRRRRSTREEQLEVIERLTRHEREIRRSGEFVPSLGSGRRWC